MADRPLHEVVAELEIGTLRMDRWQTTYVPCTAAEAAEAPCGNTEIAHMPSAALLKLAAVLKAADALVVAVEDGSDTLEERIAFKTAAADLRRALEGK